MHINEDLEETPAQFQEYCTQIALQEYWKFQESNEILKGDKPLKKIS